VKTSFECALLGPCGTDKAFFFLFRLLKLIIFLVFPDLFVCAVDPNLGLPFAALSDQEMEDADIKVFGLLAVLPLFSPCFC